VEKKELKGRVSTSGWTHRHTGTRLNQHLYVWIDQSFRACITAVLASPTTLDSVPRPAFHIKLEALERSCWMAWGQMQSTRHGAPLSA
jgi:hypothetical protein